MISPTSRPRASKRPGREAGGATHVSQTLFLFPSRDFAMMKQNLTRASAELFRRAPDERFPTLDALLTHCQREKDESADRWLSPVALVPEPTAEGRLGLRANS